MALRNTNLNDVIRRARPLEELRHQRPEFADVVRIWDEELAPELAVRETARKTAVRRAITRTVWGGVHIVYAPQEPVLDDNNRWPGRSAAATPTSPQR